MNCLRITTCLVVIVCGASGARASANFYLRPSLCYTKVSVATNEYTSGKLGFSIAAGCTFGPRQSHALELEAVSTKGMVAHYASQYTGYGTVFEETRDLTQCIIGYRYTFLPSDYPVRLFVGAAGGYWDENGRSVESTKFSYSSFVYPATTHTVSENGILAGPSVGTTIAVNSHARIELAYRQVWMLSASNGHFARQVYGGFRYVF